MQKRARETSSRLFTSPKICQACKRECSALYVQTWAWPIIEVCLWCHYANCSATNAAALALCEIATADE